MRKPRVAAQIFFLQLMILASGIVALAQSNKGTILGTVKDPNDALVTGAQVTVANSGTGEVRKATSSDDGAYTVADLEPGKYRVSVEAPGFQTVLFEDVTLETNARLPLDVKFATITGGTGTVTVSAEAAPLVESETSVRGDVITGRQVTDLPIPQRNFTLLAALSPGVTRPVIGGALGGGAGYSNAGAGNSNLSTESTRFRESGGSVISANGARATNNNFTLDGVDNNESQFGQIGIYPNPDAIAEFKVETSVPSAESGRAGGAVISTTFKSGSNAVHGTVYEFYQGRFASARPTNRPNPPNFITHNFGGTVGGPIFLPHFGEGGPLLYDGRNRSFFFFSYNGQRNATPLASQQFVTVPTAKIRAGDFSELLEPNNIVTFNTVRGQVRAPRGTVFDAAGNPFTGNVLPTTLLIPQALNVLQAFPLPTESNKRIDNFRLNRSEKYNVNGYDVKIDHAFSSSNNLFGRYSKQTSDRLRDNFFPLGSSPTGNDLSAGFAAGTEFGKSRQIAIGDTHTFSPTVINDARAGYTRVEIGIFNPGIGGANGFSATNAADLGIPNVNICGIVCSGTVLLGFVGSGSQNDSQQKATEFIGDGGPFFFTSNNFFFGDTLTVVRGSQNFKFGGDIRVRQNVNLDAGRAGNSKGNFVYTSAVENGNGFFSQRDNVPIGPQEAGQSLANFLLGYKPSSLSRGIPTGIPYLSSKEISFFVQNDWKVNPNLTLNLGLRYDLFTAPTERFNRQSNFDPATGTLIRTTKNAPNGRSGVQTDKNNFGPRLGFAYSGLKADKTVVLRGGYGMVYSTDVSSQQPLSTNFLAAGAYSFNFSDPQLNGINIGTGPLVPNLAAVTPDVFKPDFSQTIFFNDPNAKTELYHQYNLTGQWEFHPNWLAEAAYVASLGRNLLVTRNIGTNGTASRQVPFNQAVKTENTGSSSYNALQTKLEKRFSKGLSILATYTWAHAIDNTPGGFCLQGPGGGFCGPSNPVIGLSLDKGNSDVDVRHRFTFSNVYDLPFGRGRRFANDMPKGADFLIGGWQLNNVIQIQSGPVFSVFGNGGRADIIGDPFANRLPGRALNKNAFRDPQQKIFPNDPNSPKFGTSGRNIFRGQRQEFWDASLFKNFPLSFIRESFNVQLRIQAYNILNHINGYRPHDNINNGDFGIDDATSNQRQLEFSLKVIF